MTVLLASALYDVGVRDPRAVSQFLDALRSRGYDVVHRDWVNGAITSEGGITWDDVADMANKIEEEFGRKPWMP